MLLWQLFLSFLKIGAFSFGGGYAVLPLIEEEIVHNQQWLTSLEYSDLLTISQMTPGPISINGASFVGTKLAGIPGSIVATLGCITPSIIIVSFLAWLYFKYKERGLIQGVLSGLRPAVVGLIGSAGLSIIIMALWGGAIPILMGNIDYVALAIMATSFLLLRLKLIKPIGAIALCGVAGIAIYLISAYT